MLKLLVIKTDNIHQLKEQYELLGFSFLYHQHGKGPLHYSTEINDCVFEIYPLPQSISIPDSTTRLGFQLKNLPEITPRILNSNWVIISQSNSKFIIQDLDGRKIEIT